MEKITLIDTAVGSTNRGDEIIMNCVESELEWLIHKYFVLRTPSHLRGFGADECIGHLPDSAAEISQSKYKFVCGTNLLKGDMLHRTNQWNINLWNSKPLWGSVLVGVGGDGNKPTGYTKKLYKRILSGEYVHSVRNQAAGDMLDSMGLKSVNTGCVTLWKLTPAFCSSIPVSKRERVVFTLTDYMRDPVADKQLIQTLKKNYEEVFFWIQGSHDMEYMESLVDGTENIHIIPSLLRAYENVLSSGDVDYVGTRLHAGIFALRYGCRAVIVTVDERMKSMESYIPDNFIDRSMIGQLDEKINSCFATRAFIDWNAIQQWKGQFV